MDTKREKKFGKCWKISDNYDKYKIAANSIRKSSNI